MRENFWHFSDFLISFSLVELFFIFFFRRTASCPQCPENGSETGHTNPIPRVTLVYVISGRSNNTALLNFGSRLLFKHMPLQF